MKKWDGSWLSQTFHVVPIFPLGDSITAVADYYDTTVNPSTGNFKEKTKLKQKEELFSASGLTSFDPDVVKAFIDVLG